MTTNAEIQGIQQAIALINKRLERIETAVGIVQKTKKEILSEAAFLRRFRIDGLTFHDRARLNKRHPNEQAIAEAKANDPRLIDARPIAGAKFEIEIEVEDD